MTGFAQRHCLLMLSCLVLLLCAGCNEVPQPTGPATISFTKTPPIEMDVLRVDVEEEYKSPMQAPHVEQFFSTSPAEAMKIWVHDRLRPIGDERLLQVIIKDASVVQRELPRTQGIQGVFTRDQSEQYDARLEVEMRVYGKKSALSEASIHVVSTRSQTVGENASVVDRDQLFMRMTRDLMQSMDAELEKNIFAYFGNYVHFSDSAPHAPSR